MIVTSVHSTSYLDPLELESRPARLLVGRHFRKVFQRHTRNELRVPVRSSDKGRILEVSYINCQWNSMVAWARKITKRDGNVYCV